MKKFLPLFIAIAAIASFSSCSENPSGNDSKITFENAGVFHLGETKTIYFSTNGANPNDVKLSNLPSGWTGRVNTADQTINLTCGKDVGVSGTFRIPVTAGDYSTNLEVESDISLLTPFYIANEPVGIIVREKTPYADGMIMYKKRGIENNTCTWSQAMNWAEGLPPSGMWYMPSLNELRDVYAVYNGSTTPITVYPAPQEIQDARDRFNNALTSIGGDNMAGSYWSRNEYSSDPSYAWSLFDNLGDEIRSPKSSKDDGMAITMF
jgi:hypothetical protein